jgi:hypothetical protein
LTELLQGANTSANSSKWSIGDAGFISVEAFDRKDKSGTIDLLTNLLGSPPDQPLKNPGVATSRTPSTTIETITWTLNDSILRRAFANPAKTFQVDLEPLLPIYETVKVFLVDNPTVPFLVLAIRGLLLVEKLDITSTSEAIKNQLRELSLPIRMFVESLGGLSSQNVSWSPHAANVTWVGVVVEETRLNQLRGPLVELEKLRASGTIVPEQVEAISKEIRSYQPFDLADSAVEITSHIPAYSNIHVVVSHSEQPGVGLYRTLSVTYLTTDASLLRTFPEMRIMLISMFPRRVDWTPPFFETMLVWLVSLNIWANSRLNAVTTLDQKAMTFRRSPNVQSTVQEISTVLSEVSLVGTEAAVASGEVSLTKRRTSSFLETLTSKGPTRTEINVSVTPFFLADLAKFGENAGVVSSLASMTMEALAVASEQLVEIEGEVAAFQRHISDIATLQSQEASNRLNKRIQTLTMILVILTGVLAISTILQFLRR